MTLENALFWLDQHTVQGFIALAVTLALYLAGQFAAEHRRAK